MGRAYWHCDQRKYGRRGRFESGLFLAGVWTCRRCDSGESNSGGREAVERAWAARPVEPPACSGAAHQAPVQSAWAVNQHVALHIAWHFSTTASPSSSSQSRTPCDLHCNFCSLTWPIPRVDELACRADPRPPATERNDGRDGVRPKLRMGTFEQRIPHRLS